MKDTAKKKPVIVVRGQGKVTIIEAKGERVLRKRDKVSKAPQALVRPRVKHTSQHKSVKRPAPTAGRSKKAVSSEK